MHYYEYQPSRWRSAQDMKLPRATSLRHKTVWTRKIWGTIRPATHLVRVRIFLFLNNGSSSLFLCLRDEWFCIKKRWWRSTWDVLSRESSAPECLELRQQINKQVNESRDRLQKDVVVLFIQMFVHSTSWAIRRMSVLNAWLKHQVSVCPSLSC